MKINYILIIVLMFATSCGNNEEEKVHLEKIEVGKSKLKMDLNDKLTRLKKALQEEESNLAKIKEFQWGRSSSTKEEQIKQQNLKISQLEDYILGIKKEIIQANLHKTFEFQEDPSSVVNYIITSAKKKDYSKLRHLCDPYGENDNDALMICLIEGQPSQIKNDFVKNFEKSRIMGEPKITNTTAEVEIAIGENSNKLEKINLIKRVDKWYVISL